MALRAIVRAPGPLLGDCALTYLPRTPIDTGLAAEQHRGYVEALRGAGAEVRVLSSAPGLPDAPFVEDVAVLTEHLAVITRPRLELRRREVEDVAELLREVRPVTRVEAPGTLEGGDVLRIGGRVFVGRSSRTNDEGIAQLRRALEPEGFEVVAVSILGSLHLKTAATWLGGGLVLANPEWFDVRPFSGLEILPVPREEPFGCNTLRVGETLLLPASAPRTSCLLASRGLNHKMVDISEFEKAEAGLTCLSLVYGA